MSTLEISKPRFLFYGDSNTYGFDPRGPFGGRYPSSVRWSGILKKELDERCDLEFDGMNGRTLPGSRADYAWLERLVRSNSPLDFFGVMLGTNDILLTRRPDAAAAAEKMKTLLEWLLVNDDLHASEGRILLMVPPYIAGKAVSAVPFYIDGMTLPSDQFYRYYEESVRLAEIYRQMPAEYGERVLLVDAAEWDIDLAYDQVHFSEQGHSEFAKEMLQVIQNLTG